MFQPLKGHLQGVYLIHSSSISTKRVTRSRFLIQLKWLASRLSVVQHATSCDQQKLFLHGAARCSGVAREPERSLRQARSSQSTVIICDVLLVVAKWIRPAWPTNDQTYCELMTSLWRLFPVEAQYNAADWLETRGVLQKTYCNASLPSSVSLT